jgi:hypothetical protein
MAKKTLQIKKKKKITLAPQKKGEDAIGWNEAAPDPEAYNEESAHEVDADDLEFLEGLEAIEEKSFRFHCYRCGQRLKVPVSWAKMSIHCGRCDRKLIIPPPLEEDL